MNILSRLKRIIKTAKRVKIDYKKFFLLLNDPAFNNAYPYQSDRKSKTAIAIDNLLWYLKHKEVNKYYYMYGMDRLGNTRANELMSYKAFSKIRDTKNLKLGKKGYNYVGLLRDKFVFSQLLKSLHIPTPINHAIISRSGITWLSEMKNVLLTDIITDNKITINGFCKLLVGSVGKGAFPLEITNGKLFVNKVELTLNQLEEMMSEGLKNGGQYLLQERIIQHSQISLLYPHSINTIRVITFNINGKIEVFCAALRLGVNGMKVDNWGIGGIAVNIDLETGQLTGNGYFKPEFGGKAEKHPNTNVEFEGFKIPYFHEGIELVSQLHSYLYGIYSVGWDIIITPDGPAILEGNDDWGFGIPLSFTQNFRSNFLKYYKD